MNYRTLSSRDLSFGTKYKFSFFCFLIVITPIAVSQMIIGSSGGGSVAYNAGFAVGQFLGLFILPAILALVTAGILQLTGFGNIKVKTSPAESFSD